jgi:HEAT repeat protein
MRRSLISLLGLILIVGSRAASAQTDKVKKEVEDHIKVIKTSKDPKNRAEAINGLAEIAEVKANLVKPAIPVLVASLKDSDVEVRKAAVGLLAGLEPYGKDWVPNLLGVLADGEDRVVRIGAINILGGIENGVKEAIAPLLAIQTKEMDKAEGDRDGELLAAITQSLEGIRDQLANGFAVTLKESKQAKARAAAAIELTKLGQGKVERIKPFIPDLLKALKDDDAGVRGAALGGLAIAGPEPQELVPALIGMLRNIREERGVRLAVIDMLKALGPAAVDAAPFLEFLQEHESKKDEKVRDKELAEKASQALEAVKKQQ